MVGNITTYDIGNYDYGTNIMLLSHWMIVIMTLESQETTLPWIICTITLKDVTSY